MVDSRELEFRRGRASQFLHERGYVTTNISVDGWNEDGYREFVRDEKGRIQVRGDEAVTVFRPWRDRTHYEGLTRIMAGEWENTSG